MKKIMKALSQWNYKLTITGLTSLAIGWALFYLAYQIGPDKTVYPVTFIICLAGCILGWLVAILNTPYGKNDENKMGRFSKLIGTFLTGYILSKFDRVIESFISPTAELTVITGMRILLFVCFFCTMWIVVFVFRQYTAGEEEEIIDDPVTA